MNDPFGKLLVGLVVGLFLIRAEPLHGQIYENRTWPASLEWRNLEEGPFRILYPSGVESEARETLSIGLEHLNPLQERVGGSLRRFPIILNSVNDLNNGFVSPIHFRSEIYLSPRRGTTFHPLSRSWLDQVVPHELVHALHYNHHAPGLIRWIRPFSPDLARSLHATAPSGMFEGIAVWAETSLLPAVTGRGDHSLFRSPFLDALEEGRPWSMGQLTHPSRYHYPLDRHYSGSWFWTDWLIDTYGEEIYRKTIRAHSQWPLFGFGFSLRRSTGEWPGDLYRQFREELTRRYFNREIPAEPEGVIPARLSAKHTTYRSPQWITGSSLLIYREGVSVTPGLVHVDLEKERMTEQIETGMSEGMDLAPLSDGTWIYSDYRNRPRFDAVRYLDLFRYHPDRNQRERITTNARLYHAVESGNEVLALQVTGQRNRLVRVMNGRAEPILDAPRDGQFEQLATHPSIDGLSAVTIRRGREMGLWIVREGRWEEVMERAPDLHLPGSVIRDPAWHPVEEKLLFSSDDAGSYDLFLLDTTTDSLVQWTRHPIHQIEPSWSPDGKRIAWSQLVSGRYEVRIDSTTNIVSEQQSVRPDKSVDVDLWLEPQQQDVIASDRNEGTSYEPSSRYRPGLSWTRPRMVLPFWRQYEDDTWMIGLQMASTELLGRQTYHAQSGWMANQLWGEIVYRNSHIWPEVEVELYRRPRFHSVQSLGNIGQTSRFYQLLTRRDGAALSIPFQWSWQNRPDYSSLLVQPRIQFQQEDVYRERDRTLFGENGIRTLASSLLFTYQHRIQQQLRDLQPGSGWILFARGEAILDSKRRGSEQILFPGYGERSISAGIYRYLRLPAIPNGTARLGARMVQQTIQGRYSIDRILQGSYSSTGLDRVREAVVLEHRWVVPLWWIDKGGLLVPVHAHGLYGVLFGETILPTGNSSIDGVNSRSQLGAGLRFRGQWGRFTLDFGIGWIYDWNRSDGFFYGGDF